MIRANARRAETGIERYLYKLSDLNKYIVFKISARLDQISTRVINFRDAFKEHLSYMDASTNATSLQYVHTSGKNTLGMSLFCIIL